MTTETFLIKQYDVKVQYFRSTLFYCARFVASFLFGRHNVTCDYHRLNYTQSSTQWPPLTSRTDLCQRLTVSQDSCKMHLCSICCYLEFFFLSVYIFIRFCKEYDKNIVFMDCQVHFLNIYLKRKEIRLIFFRHFVELPAKK